jgi:O-antigen/teichoic acid export membrane protein
MAIWIIAGVKLIDDLSIMIEDLSIFAQVMVMLVLTIFAPAIWLTQFAEEIIDLIAGDGWEGFDDDG